MKRTLAKLAMMAALLASPGAVHALCAGFTDVAADSFCPNVEWLKNRSITTGCTSLTLYCPNEPVIRLAMAAFLNRLGTALTPDVLYVDVNPGPVAIQGGAYQFVCPSAPYPVVGFPRRAVANGVVFGIVDFPVTWTADVWFSTDGGATFFPIMNFFPQQTATAAGTMSQGTTFARMDLDVGSTYIFAILVRESPDVPGTGNFTDLACNLMVQIGNRNGTSTPFDPAVSRPQAGQLHGNAQD